MFARDSEVIWNFSSTHHDTSAIFCRLFFKETIFELLARFRLKTEEKPPHFVETRC